MTGICLLKSPAKQATSTDQPCMCATADMHACLIKLLDHPHAGCSRLQPEKLDFRQNPTFADCYPSSEKQYTEVEHGGEQLRVSAAVLGVACTTEMQPCAAQGERCPVGHLLHLQRHRGLQPRTARGLSTLGFS